MTTLVLLYISFFKIGLFGFGGGYVMISLIQEEITTHGWLTVNEFIDLIAIAQMTPGPIAINSATFVGYRAASVLGAFIATLGVISPSFIMVMILAKTLKRMGDSPLVSQIVMYLRPVIIALIFTAAWSLGKQGFGSPLGILIAGLVLTGLLFTKVHPIIFVLMAGFIGIVFY